MGEAKLRKKKGSYRKGGRRPSGPWLLGGGLLLASLIVLGVVYWISNPTISPVDDLPTVAPGAPPFPAELDRYGVSVGEPNASVVVREFADYQCPACARFAGVMERFKREYVDTGKARIVFFDFPLRQHPNAVPAALAARCAGDQGAYWPMHTMLFERQSRWEDADDPGGIFRSFASELNLNQQHFDRCMRTERHARDIAQSAQAGATVRVAATPTVFVDNVRLTQPGWYQLAGVVERQLPADRSAQ